MKNENTKHTPGPWKIEANVPKELAAGNYEAHFIKADNEVERPVCSLWVGGGTHGKEIQQATARLIAAAPDLLEAVRDCLACLDNLEAVQMWNKIGGDHIDEAVNCQGKAREAIAKATGGAE